MDYEEIMERELESLGPEGLDQLTEMGREALGDRLSLGDVLHGLLTGESSLNAEDLWQAVLELFLGEVWSAVELGAQILLICVVMGLLHSLSSGFGGSGASGIAIMVCNCAAVALCLREFVSVYAICGDAVDTTATVMQILLPIMVPLLLAMGSPATAGILNPAILAAVTVFAGIVHRIVLPLLFLSCVLFLGDCLSEKHYVKKLAGFFRTLGVFSMGLCVTLFTGLTVIRGLFTKTADGLLMRTARYSVDHFVPLVGSFAADSLEMVLRCTATIKNGVGIFGVVVILALLVTPLLKLAATALVFKLSGALAEPIGSGSAADCLNEIGNTVLLLGAVLLLETILFLVFLAVLINISVA
ncbi:MAG: stage III sporulation protein AE [Bacillota bacterium]|nr:stage III sporulation protein AE [Bacillota bacterium]